MVVQRSLEVATESRPAKAPEAVTTCAHETASDLTGLPTDVFWSGAPLDFDLSHVRDRFRVDRRVLVKGNADDILDYVDPGELIERWPRIFHPSCLLQPWEGWRRSMDRQLTTLTHPQNQGALVVAGVVGALDRGVAAQHRADVRLGFNLEKS